MKVRYTATASREFDQAVEYLLQQAPHLAPAFADSVEHAIAELIENPLSAQETEQPSRPSEVHSQVSLCAVLLSQPGCQ
jgi:plasmid stabilization system protein ParE